MDYRNVPNKYRPIPFWSWNDKLEPQEIVYQVQKMRDAGINVI